MSKTYKGPVIEFPCAGKTVYVRAKATHAIIPDQGIGKVDLPAWLADQRKALDEYEKAKKDKAPAPRLAYLEGRVVFPSMLERYLETGSTSRLWEVQNSPDFEAEDFGEAKAQAEKAKAENEAQSARIAELEAELAALRGDEDKA